jgi:thymidylate synthase (FAD)
MNNNSVELLGFYGGDKTHCLSAWTSTFEELGIELPDTIEDRIDVIFNYVCKLKKKTPEELLEMLATEGHHTPFEKSCIHFQATTEIATHIQLLKHRVGVSINGESGRYKELTDKYYLPEDWKGIKCSNPVIIEALNMQTTTQKEFNWAEVLDSFTDLYNYIYHQAIEDFQKPLGRKRAKESARFFKGYNMQYTVDIMFNWRSFSHFIGLRKSEHSQKEIRNLATEMLQLVKNIPGNPFELTLKAFAY